MLPSLRGAQRRSNPSRRWIASLPLAMTAVCATNAAMTREMLLALALGYLLGSIPFGLLLTRLAGKGDIRDIGSGNIGATNVLRTGSKRAGRRDADPRLPQGDGRDPARPAAVRRRETGVARRGRRMIGHLYPVWLRFKGGKGVATFLGVLIAAAAHRGRRLRRRLAGPAADDPNLVGRGHGRRGQRARSPPPSSATIPYSHAARFRCARPVEAPREYPSPAERNRATHEDRRPRRPPEAGALARNRAGHLPPADRPLRQRGRGARRRSRPRPARRRQRLPVVRPRRGRARDRARSTSSARVI